MESTDDKKYWCDQIKTLLGPCMITFAIPLMIPGFTITFVAFADENAFPKYGALHVVGILILAISIILILLGCILRLYWKPFIGPDIEMHLSPNVSCRSVRPSRVSSRNTHPDNHTNETALPSQIRNSFRESERARMDNIPTMIKKKETKSESETDATGSESELKKSLTGSIGRGFNIMASPRSRNLVPVNSESFAEPDPNNSHQETNCFESESFEVLQDWRKKKKRAKKHRKPKKSDVEDEGAGENTIPKGTQSNSDNENSPTIKEQKPKRKKKKKKVLSSLRHEQSKIDEDNLNFQLSKMREAKVPEIQIFKQKDEKQDSDNSSASIGSADSVLAQYTSRKKEGDDIV